MRRVHCYFRHLICNSRIHFLKSPLFHIDILYNLSSAHFSFLLLYKLPVFIFPSFLYLTSIFDSNMHSFTASTSGPAILFLLSFGSSAVAQLLGCDAVGCPVDEYRTPQCEIGNATLKAIGITNVTTLLDSQPLTWTLGLQELKAEQPTFDRNFYLGTAPSLSLNDTTSCALFFEGVSSNLTTSAGNQLNKFTCSDALPAACISDLLTQAQSSFDTLEDTSSSSICSQLRDTLLTKPPPTCNLPQNTWGTILATRKPLLPPTIPSHSN